MNKKYIINEEGIVTVKTDKEEIIKRIDKYNKNTSEILALENVIESLNNKISWFDKEIIDLENKINHNVFFMIAQFILSLLLILILNLFMTNLITLNSLLMLGLIEISLISTITSKTIKHKNKIEKYNKKIKHINHIIKKANKKIETLSKDKTPVEIEKVNEYQEVSNIYDYNFDASDYFIHRYNIDKRTQEFNNSNKKVRKLTKTNNTELLKYQR